MGRRILAFFLGMIFGIIFFLGAIAGGLYIAATVMHPSDLWGDSSKYLGDLADLSLFDIYKSISELYRSKLGIPDENGSYFTFGQFCEHYNIDPNELFGGKQVPQDVLDIPIFELIGGQREEAYQKIKVSAIPGLINMFLGGAPAEDGSTNALFPDSVLTKLSAHSVAELMGEGGIAAVFAEVQIAEVAMGMLPLERTEDNALIWALGQAKLGPMLGGMDGNLMLQFKPDGAFEALGGLPLVELLGNSSQILNAFFGSNALADLIDEEGNLNPDDMLNGVYLGDIVGLQRDPLTEEQLADYTESELYNDNVRLLTGPDGKLALQTEDNAYVAELICSEEDEEHTHNIDCYGFVWYSTTAADTPSDDDMVTEDGRYPRATGMYAAIADVTVGMLTSGDSSALLDRFMNVPLKELLEGQEMSGIFENLAEMTIGELIDGGIDGMYLGQMLGFKLREIDKPQGDIIELYKSAAHTEDEKPSKYLIKDAEGNVAALSPDGKVWYEGEIVCTKEEHTHSGECGAPGEYTCGKEEHAHDVSGCYGFVWYEQCTEEHDHSGDWSTDGGYYSRTEGLMAKIADKQISDLSSLDDMLMELTLRDVMGDKVPDILKALKDVPIGELNDAINDLYLGELLSFRRRPIDEAAIAGYTDAADASGAAIADIKKKEGETTLYAKQVDGVWYEAYLSCIDEEHVHGDECEPGCTKEEHRHDANCFGFVWYTKCEEEHDHSEQGDWLPDEDNDEGSYYIPATGMMAKLSDEQVCNLNKLDEAARRLTLEDVLGDGIPGMLGSLKDTPIGNIGNAIDNLYIGQLLEYRRRTVEELGRTEEEYNAKELHDPEGSTTGAVKLDAEGNAIKKDEGSWYEATLTCTNKAADHTHDASCYGFVWYKECTSADGDTHDGAWRPADSEAHFVLADGMMGKLADEKVNNLGNLNDTIQRFTLHDVMGDNIPKSLASLADIPISGLGSAIDEMYLGSFLQYVKKPVSVDGYEDVDGTGGSVKKLGDSYARLGEDGVWYDAALNCTDSSEEHSHSTDCYRYNWFTLACKHPEEHTDAHTDDCYTAADRLIGRLARLKINELSGDNIINTVNDTPLGDVLDLDSSNGLLKELSTVKIGELSGELDAVYVGIAMNYKRQEVQEEDIVGKELVVKDQNIAHIRHDEIVKDASGSFYFHDTKHDKYYKAEMICNLEVHTHNDGCGVIEDGVGKNCEKKEHTEHTFTCYGFVWYDCTHKEDGHVHGTVEDNTCRVAKGLNAKISNLRIDELTGNGLTSIAVNLTVGDVMESDMMDLNPENISFLAIVFENENHNDCGLLDYLLHGNNNPEEYWRSKHDSEPNASHGLEWQELPLSKFISEMLSKITEISIPTSSFPGLGG